MSTRCVRWMLQRALILTSLAVSARDARAQIVPLDTSAVSLSARSAIANHLQVARLYWLQSQKKWAEGSRYVSPQLARKAYVHCHVTDFGRGGGYRIDDGYDAIGSEHGAFGKCPTWLIGDSADLQRTTSPIGFYVSTALYPTLKTARGQLLDSLEQIARRSPENVWVLGQRVRFLVEDGRAADALVVAEGCTTPEVWCNLLAGYARHARNDFAAADRSVRRALAVATPAERCMLSDIHALLPERARDAFLELNCTDAIEATTRFWWLSQPAFITPFNERRAEHYARLVSAILHASITMDERYDWRQPQGGDAIFAMILRYGWPTSTVWVGKPDDDSHDNYLRVRASPLVAPYSTAEYSPGRFGFGFRDPLSTDLTRIADTSWQVAPPKADMTMHRTGRRMWWPQEHMLLPGVQVAELPEGQLAVFRRVDKVRVAAAVSAKIRDTARAMQAERRPDTLSLLASPEPDVVWPIARVIDGTAQKLVVDGEMPSRPVLLGLELHGGDRPRTVVRSRRGLVPPPTLNNLPADSIALSDPVLFEMGATSALPSTVDAMLPRMLPETTLPRQRVGVFWETYGVAAGDSAEFSIAIRPTSEAGFLRQAAAALRLMAPPPVGVTIGWREPSRRDASVSIGTHAIYGRSVAIDLAPLKRGDYALEITARVLRGATARTTRAIQIR